MKIFINHLYHYSQKSIPPDHREEYILRQTALMKSRVNLFCIMATLIFFLVAVQYVFRNLVVKMQTFKSVELVVWVILMLGAFFTLKMNAGSTSLKQSRRAAYVFTLIFLYVLISIGVIYVENSTIFVFYFAFAFLLTTLSIPWRLADVAYLTGLYFTAYTLYYMYVSFVMKVVIPHFSRFHPYADGIIFIGIAVFMSVVIRKKEIERDVENFVLLKQVEEKNTQIDEELLLATHIHKTLLPKSIRTEAVDITVSYIPVSTVGGDYAKFRFLNDDKLVFFISDVTGHGMPAALLVNRIHSEFERLARERRGPGELLSDLNQFILRDFEGTNMYVSAFCGLLDFKNKKLSYSSYGHPAQYIYHATRLELASLEPQGGLLGLPFDDSPVIHEREVPFDEGDSILLFTDGVLEAVALNGDFYGEERLKDFLRANYHLDHDALNTQLLKELTQFGKGGFRDDIFILTLKTKRRNPSVLTKPQALHSH